MSVQVGVLSFGDREMDPEEIDFLFYGLEDRAPDYSGTHIAERLAMGFRGLLITPEDKKDQPMRSSGGAVITFDGRLDQRASVARRVGLPESTNISDVTLAMIAYEQAGLNSFEQLMGEYACVLWDARRGSLFMVRSLCGTRPLYYIVTNRQVVWSSELDDIVLKSDISPTVNDSYIYGLTYFQPDVDESPFKDVKVVPPGCYVEITQCGEIKVPVSTWHPERISTLKLSSDTEYEEAWREQVEIAIGDKLRVKGPVFAELSGGLDSSTVVTMADRVLAKTGGHSDALNTASLTYETSENCDERTFIAEVERVRTGGGFHISELSQKINLGLDSITFTGAPSFHHIFPGWYQQISKRMEAAHCRVLLTGNGGDELFWSDPTGSPELADLLVQGRLFSLIAKAREWSQVSGTPLWKLLLHNAIEPITVGRRFLRLGADQLPTLCSLNSAEVAEWLGRPLSKFGLKVDAGIRLPSRRTLAFSVLSCRALLSAACFCGYHRFHFSHPLMHQQLVDFMLSLPMEQIARPGEGRSIVRRATRGILPERVRNRRSKAGPDESFARVLSQDGDRIGDPASLLICQRGYTEATAFAEAVREVSLGRLEQSGAVIQMLSVERWLRSLAMIASARSALKAAFRETRVASLGLLVDRESEPSPLSDKKQRIAE
jgi:asparagine synthase (glutamine-hydrolysing)